MDFHCDGKVNYSEFLAATISSIQFSKEERLWSAFNYFDTTGSGYITLDSVIDALKESGVVVDEQGLQKTFQELPKKGEKINFKEFKIIALGGRGDMREIFTGEGEGGEEEGEGEGEGGEEEDEREEGREITTYRNYRNYKNRDISINKNEDNEENEEKNFKNLDIKELEIIRNGHKNKNCEDKQDVEFCKEIVSPRIGGFIRKSRTNESES